MSGDTGQEGPPQKIQTDAVLKTQVRVEQPIAPITELRGDLGWKDRLGPFLGTLRRSGILGAAAKRGAVWGATVAVATGPAAAITGPAAAALGMLTEIGRPKNTAKLSQTWKEGTGVNVT